jgi:HemY protein
MSMTLFVLGSLVAFVLGYLLVRLVSAAMQLPQFVRTFRSERTRSKAREAMLEALSAFFEGRYAAAEKAAVKAMGLGEFSGLNSIIAARAANELRAFERRDAYLANAEGRTVGEETMRLMAKAEFHLDQKQPQSALSSLKELSGTGIRKHIGALNLELKAQQQVRNWDAVLDVANQLAKRNAINTSMATQMRQQAWLEKMRGCADDVEMMRGVWKSMPAEFKRRNKTAAEAARIFMQQGEMATARSLLTESLNAEWDSELITLYGDCFDGSAIEQIDQAERWFKTHHDDAGLLLALGKLCLHQELWGKAQSYLDASNSIQPSQEAYNALAKLAEKLHKPDETFNYYMLASGLSEAG